MNANVVLMEMAVAEQLEARRREARHPRLANRAWLHRLPVAHNPERVQWRRRLAYLLLALVVPALLLAAGLA